VFGLKHCAIGERAGEAVGESCWVPGIFLKSDYDIKWT